MANDAVGLTQTYPDLPTREAANTGNNPQCFSGADLVDGSTWDGANDDGITLFIADGHKHDGTTAGDETTVAQINHDSADIRGIFNSALANLTIDGLRVITSGDRTGNIFAIHANDDNTEIRNCMVVMGADSTANSHIGILTSGGATNTKYINNIVIALAGADAALGLHLYQCHGGGGDEISHNTGINFSSHASSNGMRFIQGTWANVYNNIMVGSTIDFRDDETATLTASGTNISEDATAPGAGSITGETAATLFVDGTTSAQLVAGSAAIGVGTDRIAVPGLGVDNQGETRTVPVAIGALVFPVAGNEADDRVRNRRFHPGYKPWLIHRQGAA